jgi:glycine dehydrogenase subunit 1
VQKTAYLRQKLQAIRSRAPFSGRRNNEFVLRTLSGLDILRDLEHEKILGGIPLGNFFDDSDRDFLVAVTELNSREQLDHFASALSAAISRERR